MIGSHDEHWVLHEQLIDWAPNTWNAYWKENKLPGQEFVVELAEVYWEEHTIRRQLVHDWATGDSVRFLIAAMAWGFGTSPDGPYRVRSMLVDDDGKARPSARSMTSSTMPRPDHDKGSGHSGRTDDLESRGWAQRSEQRCSTSLAITHRHPRH